MPSQNKLIKARFRILIDYIFLSNKYRVKLLLKMRAKAKENCRFKLARFFSNRLQRYGFYVSPNSEIARTVKFPHPVAIVIGEGVVIEEGVTIFQNVTLGGARLGDGKNGNYPHILKNTTIFSGAVVVGGIKIGQGCIIGANAVVLHDIPDFMTAVGVPARIITKSTTNEKAD